MSTSRNKSFLATFTVNGSWLHFPGQTFNEKVTVLHYDTPSIATEVRDVSNVLTMIAVNVNQPLVFYCRNEDDYYTFYNRTPGPYYGKVISKNQHDKFAALPAAGRDTTTFNFLDLDGNIITLDDIQSDQVDVRIQTRAGAPLGLNNKFSKINRVHHFIGEYGTQLTWRMKILERNTPYISDPDEV